MSISHPPQPPTGGSADCGHANPGQGSTMPDWVWLTQRFEDNVEAGFGAWIDSHLQMMEADLSEFAASQEADGRQRSL